MSLLEIQDLHIDLGEFALKGVSLGLEEGDYLNIIGPTGAGKTILLESIIGFWRPDKGRIFLEGRDITDERPEKRKIGIVYQDYALLPHFSVYKNIAYGLKKHQKENVKDSVEKMAASLQIEHLLHRMPDTLSGGEQQRVALARALIVEPRLLLMDEPFSALDPQTRRQARFLLKKAIQERGTTVIHITHDLDDAWVFASKLAIFRRGRMLQFGPLEEVFNRPRSSFIAEFVGANLFRGTVTANGSGPCKVDTGGFCLRSSDRAEDGAEVQVAVRHEEIDVCKERPAKGCPDNIVQATLSHILSEGKACLLSLAVDGSQMDVLLTRDAVRQLNAIPGDSVYAVIRAEDVKIVGSN